MTMRIGCLSVFLLSVLMRLGSCGPVELIRFLRRVHTIFSCDSSPSSSYDPVSCDAGASEVRDLDFEARTLSRLGDDSKLTFDGADTLFDDQGTAPILIQFCVGKAAAEFESAAVV